jgi:hypothetical protein
MEINDLSKDDVENEVHLINSKEAKKNFSHWSKQKLTNHLIDLEKKMNEIRNASLNSYTTNSHSVNPANFNTKKNWPMAEKIYMILLAQQKPLNREELNSLLLNWIFNLNISYVRIESSFWTNLKNCL